MAHRRPLWISVAEMKLYYIYSEWCSWLHSQAEGESWGLLREWAHCAAWCSVAGVLLMREVVSSIPASPLGSETTRLGSGVHGFSPHSCHLISL